MIVQNKQKGENTVFFSAIKILIRRWSCWLFICSQKERRFEDTTKDQNIYHNAEFTALSVVVILGSVRLTEWRCEVENTWSRTWIWLTLQHRLAQIHTERASSTCTHVFLSYVCVCALHWHTLSSRFASMCLSSCCLQSAGILEVMSSGFWGTTGLTLMVSSGGFSGQVARV